MQSNYKKRQRELNQFLDQLLPGMNKKFRESTPVRSGNARANTELRDNEIHADYPYAVRLEKESWSRQAPEGMSKPTIEWARQQLRKL